MCEPTKNDERHDKASGVDEEVGGENNDVTIQEVKAGPNDEQTTNEETKDSCLTGKVVKDFYWTNEFLIHVIIVILIAKAYPSLGSKFLFPEITATWIAVIFIFLLAGMSLKTKELKKSSFTLF